MLAITYDDGPYIYTEALLNLLRSVEVQATFFVTGSNLGKGQIDDPSTPWPGILRRMHDAGHQVGSHTWTHRDLNQANATIRRAEIIHNEMALRNIFDWIPTYFRPPYLECDVASGCGRMISDFSYHSVSTNLDTKDYMFDQPESIQQSKDRFLDGLPEDPIVNLTSFMVQVARQRGYRLVTIGECLGDPRQNWYRIVDNLE
ncbi:polysaccharide deacetylase [Moelleriella libera RCEF 2490]|uniref:Polysaccharide deacetylase n=1 Tax=Moelleriella libera RCEF 2490 TaxID=1081109 RepID=A0A162ID19_9HYPO|nr:polysaccharide deacetylase [Moelleriella libera RCEF 2490]